MQRISSWIQTFDLSKAVLLAIVAVLGSWYDLRGEVKSNKQDLEATKQEIFVRMDAIKAESIFRWTSQEKVDTSQNLSIKEIHEEVRDGFKELKQVVRDNAGVASGRR